MPSAHPRVRSSRQTERGSEDPAGPCGVCEGLAAVCSIWRSGKIDNINLATCELVAMVTPMPS